MSNTLPPAVRPRAGIDATEYGVVDEVARRAGAPIASDEASIVADRIARRRCLLNRSGIATNTFTFSGNATGDEGTNVQWNSVDHVTSVGDPFEDPAAIVKVAFRRFHCH